MSSSFGGGSSGDIRYTITVDDAQAVQKLQSVGQQFGALATAGQQAQQGIQQVPQALTEVATEGDKATQSLQQETVALESSGKAAATAGTQQQSLGSIMKNNIGAIVGMASGVLGLVSSYTGLQRTQLAINKLQVTESNQRRLLDVLTRKHAEAVAKYGANSAEALDIQAKIDILEQKNINTKEQLALRQEQQTQQQIAFGLSVVQTGASVVQMASQLKGMGSVMKTTTAATVGMTGSTVAASGAVRGLGISMKTALIGTGIGAIIVAIGTALAAFSQNWWGVRDSVNAAGVQLGRMVPILRPILMALQEVGNWVVRIFGGQVPQTAHAAAVAIDGVSDSSGELAVSQKVLDKEMEEVNKAAEEQTQRMNEIADAHAELFKEFQVATGSKGEDWDKQWDMLKDLGLGKNEIKDIKFGIKWEFTKPQEAFDQFVKTSNFAEEFSLSPKTKKKIATEFSKDLKEVMKNAGSDLDILQELIDIIDKNKSNPDLPKIISTWLATLPDEAILELKNHGIDPYQIAIALGFDPLTLNKATQDNVDKAISNVKLDVSKIKFTTPAQNKSIWSMFGTGAGAGGGAAQTGWLADITKQFQTAFSPASLSKVRDQIVKGLFAAPANLSATLKTFVDPITNQILVFLLQSGPLIISEFVAKTFTWANFQTALSSLASVFTSITTFIVDTMRDPATLAIAISDFATDVLTQIGTWLVNSMPQTAETLAKVGTLIGGGIMLGLQTLTDWGTTAFEWIGKQLTENATLENILKAGELIGGAIMLGLQTLTDFGTTAVDWMAGQITAAAKGVWQAGKDIAGQIWEGMKATFSTFSLADILPSIQTDPNMLDKWDPMKGGFTKQALGGPQGDLGAGDPGVLGKGGGSGLNGGVGFDKYKQLLIGGGGQGQGGGMFASIFKEIALLQAGFIRLAAHWSQVSIGMIATAQSFSTVATAAFTTFLQNTAGLMTMLAASFSAQGAAMIATATSVATVATGAFSTFLQNTAGLFTMLAAHWSGQGEAIIATSQSVAQVSQDVLNQALENVAGVMNNFASHWSGIANSIINNAESAGEGIQDSLEGAMDNVEGKMSDLASHWSKMCNSMIKNAKSAAKGIQSAMNSIKDTESIHTIRTVRVGAAAGFHGLVTHPTTFTVAEHSPEFVHVTSEKDTKDILHTTVRGSSKQTTQQILLQTVNLNISGNDIINTRSLKKMIRVEPGRERDRNL